MSCQCLNALDTRLVSYQDDGVVMTYLFGEDGVGIGGVSAINLQPLQRIISLYIVN